MQVCALLPNAAHSAPKRPFHIWQHKLQTQIKVQIQTLAQAGTREPNPHPHTDFVSWSEFEFESGSGSGFVYFGILRKSQQLNTRTSERVTLRQTLEANEGFVRVSCHDDQANLSLLIWNILATNINLGREKTRRDGWGQRKRIFGWQQFRTTPTFDNFHTASAPNALWCWTVADNFCTADSNNSWL